MFDRLIQPSDDDAGRRSAVSFAFTSAVCVAAVGGFLLGSLLFEVAVPPPLIVESAVVLLEPDGGGADTPLPAAPEKPRPEPTPRAETNPDAPPAIVAPPIEAPPSDGGGGGTGSKVGPGTGTGPPGIGTIPRGTADPVQSFAHPKLVIRKRVDPAYPETARALGLGEQRCLATVYIDEDGAPYEVEIAACPTAFHEAARDALMQWRWYPPKDGKDRIKAQTAVGITYRLDR